jgi:3-deoxy-D-manno-octulosonic acid kinase
VSHGLKTRVLQTKRIAQTGYSLEVTGETGAKLVWGDCPEGFERLVDGCGNRLVIRQDQRDYIDFSLFQISPAKAAGESPYHGRGAIWLSKLANGETAVIRPYLHGGALRRLTGDRFFTWPPRPFRELAITEELRRRSLRTLEIYAACVSRPFGPFYRGWLVTRRLPDAEDLWLALQTGLAERLDFDRVLRIVAESIAALHRQGVYHADLNLKNILIRAEGTDVTAYVIDFDKSKVFLGKLPALIARKNLDRFERSVRKLDPERKFLPAEAWNRFLSYYHAAFGS